MAGPARHSHRYLAFGLTAVCLAVLPTGTAMAAGTFTDDDGNQHEGYIEAIVADGITGGCAVGPARYCPEQDVRRDQMASFLARALDLPAASRDHFLDDAGNTHEDNINRAAEAGITLGDGTGRYAPIAGVRRDQIASFLSRALGLPAASRDFFTDDAGNTHEDNINRLAEAGVTVGDGAGSYSPTTNVRRDQMASFLGRGLGLSPAPTDGAATFGPGAQRVGADVTADTYRSGPSDESCYWKRLSGFSGDFSDTIASDLTEHRTLVTIADTDEGFDSDGCGTWSNDLSPITSSPTAPFGGGIFLVGTDVAADTYRSGPSDEKCYWARLSGFSGNFADVIAGEYTEHRTLATITDGDEGFDSEGCGTWSNDLSPITSSPTAPFGGGTFLVGTDVAADTYRSGPSGETCYWNRLSGFRSQFVDVIAGDVIEHRTLVTIDGSDRGFQSDGCGTWSNDLSPITPSPIAPFGGGTFLVGTDVAPGTWQNDDSSKGCVWRRLSGFSGEPKETIDVDLTQEQAVVTIADDDAGFESSDCGTWTRVE